MSAWLERLQWSDKYKTSLYALVAANLFPLLGVLFFGWRVGDIMLLFWAENVVIGAYNVVRMVVSAGRGIWGFFINLPIIAFFTVHYGGFTFIHGIFVVFLFVAPGLGEPLPESAAESRPVVEITEDPETWPYANKGEMTDEEFEEFLDEVFLSIRTSLFEHGLWVAILALIFSHGISLRTNFIQSGEYKRATADTLMFRPYGRVVILHLVIILGAGLVVLTGQMTAALLMLILLKIAFDAGAHLYERGRLAARP